ncbi:hypothetical protein Tco_0420999 [Tanacetum coccineum]
MSSDSASSEVTYTSISSHGDPLAWDVDLFGLQEPDSLEAAPTSPDYMPGPNEPEQAPPSPDYVPGPEYPEYLAPVDDEIVVEDQPYVDYASPVALSSGYVADSDTRGGLWDGSSRNYLAVREEEEEHLALVESIVAPAVDPVPSSEETEPFEKMRESSTAARPIRGGGHSGQTDSLITKSRHIDRLDREFHQETVLLMEQEALVSREAWAYYQRLRWQMRHSRLDIRLMQMIPRALIVVSSRCYILMTNMPPKRTFVAAAKAAAAATRVAAATATAAPMTNSYMKTVTQDVAYTMDWKTLKKMMTVKYCSRGEIIEELALMCGRMFHEESDEVEKYVGGLPDMIRGNVMSYNPKTMEKAIEFANDQMDQKVLTIYERQVEQKRNRSLGLSACASLESKNEVCLLYEGLPTWHFIQLGGNSRVDEMILARERSGFAGEKAILAIEMLWEWRGIANMDEMILARERSGFSGEKVWDDIQVVPGFVGREMRLLGK